MCQVSTKVEHAEIFKRFIDDIVWLSFGNQASQNIKTKLLETFAKYYLTLKHRDINTTEENGELEFLDILHKISLYSQFRFVTTNYIKRKAIQAQYPKPLVEDVIAKAKTWTNRFKPPTTNESQKPQSNVWTTSFKNLIKLSKKEKELQPHNMVTYKNPFV